MNAEQFNARYPIGTPVFAYPGARPEDVPSARRLVTRTRSEAQPFGLDREGVVWVDGHGACIALTHIDVVTDTEPITDLATAVEIMGALPMPAGPAAPKPRWQQARTELIAKFYAYMPVTGAKAATDLLDEVIAESLLEGTAEIQRLKDELERRTEDLAFLERTTLPELRRTIQRHEDGKKRWRARAEKAEPERDALQERLHQIALAKVWTNEDRKKFVFVEDIVGPLFGIEPKEAGR